MKFQIDAKLSVKKISLGKVAFSGPHLNMEIKAAHVEKM